MPTGRDTYCQCVIRNALLAALCTVSGGLLTGCDKLQAPEFGQPAAQPAPAPPAATLPTHAAPVSSPIPVAPLAKPDSKQQVAAFLKKAKEQGVNDRDLIELTSIEDTEGFAEILELRLSGDQITDAGVSRLSKFSKLAKLDLSNSRVTNAGIEVVKDLPELSSLRLNQTAADDQVMSSIALNSGIKELSLAGTAITDFGLNELEKLNELEVLDISGTSITGAGFERFKGHKHLRSVLAVRSGLQSEALRFLTGSPIEVLEIDSSPVSDPGMVHVGRMKKLKRLSMSFTSISDVGIHRLGVMKDLEYVNVRNDVAISRLLFQKLVTCKKLKYVCSTGTRITATDCAKLKKLFPNCEIVH